MTLKSKGTIVSLVMGAAVLAGYIVLALSKVAPAADDLKRWAIFIIGCIGISVGIQVVTQVFFQIFAGARIAAKEGEKDKKKILRIISSEMAEDERDKKITLKTSHIGYGCVGIGFILALIALACGARVVVVLHILLGACFVAALIEGIISIYMYEKGSIKRIKEDE